MALTIYTFPFIETSPDTNNRWLIETSPPTKIRWLIETSPPTNNRWFNETSPLTNKRELNEASKYDTNPPDAVSKSVNINPEVSVDVLLIISSLHAMIFAT